MTTRFHNNPDLQNIPSFFFVPNSTKAISTSISILFSRLGMRSDDQNHVASVAGVKNNPIVSVGFDTEPTEI